MTSRVLFTIGVLLLSVTAAFADGGQQAIATEPLVTGVAEVTSGQPRLQMPVLMDGQEIIISMDDLDWRKTYSLNFEFFAGKDMIREGTLNFDQNEAGAAYARLLDKDESGAGVTEALFAASLFNGGTPQYVQHFHHADNLLVASLHRMTWHGLDIAAYCPGADSYEVHLEIRTRAPGNLLSTDGALAKGQIRNEDGVLNFPAFEQGALTTTRDWIRSSIQPDDLTLRLTREPLALSEFARIIKSDGTLVEIQGTVTIMPDGSMVQSSPYLRMGSDGNFYVIPGDGSPDTSAPDPN